MSWHEFFLSVNQWHLQGHPTSPDVRILPDVLHLLRGGHGHMSKRQASDFLFVHRLTERVS